MFDIPEDLGYQCGDVITGIAQGSDEWKTLRAGKVTSTGIKLVMSSSAEKLTRHNYAYELAAERLTGKPNPEGYKSKSMKKGNADEPLAREAYEFVNDVTAELVTFVLHPTIEHAGASPDALIGTDGGLEIKCPDLKTQLLYLDTQKVPRHYWLQIQWHMACTGREWFDFMSFAKELPMHLRKLIIRVPRDDTAIAKIEKEVLIFNQEIDLIINRLNK
jgi:putative phage-type endonuclease